MKKVILTISIKGEKKLKVTFYYTSLCCSSEKKLCCQNMVCSYKKKQLIIWHCSFQQEIVKNWWKITEFSCQNRKKILFLFHEKNNFWLWGKKHAPQKVKRSDPYHLWSIFSTTRDMLWHSLGSSTHKKSNCHDICRNIVESDIKRH